MVQGSFEAGTLLEVKTSNALLDGSFRGYRVEVGTTNAVLSGDFTATQDLIAHNQNGKIEGTFNGALVALDTSNAAISAKIHVAHSLNLFTTYYRIDAEITLSRTSTAVEPVVNDSQSFTSIPTTLASAEPPSFDDVLEARRRSGLVDVVIETCDASVAVEFVDQPKDVALKSFVKGSGGAKVSVTHRGAFLGTFSVSLFLYPTKIKC